MVRTCRDILEDPLNDDIFGIIANFDIVHEISIIHAISWTLNAFGMASRKLQRKCCR